MKLKLSFSDKEKAKQQVKPVVDALAAAGYEADVYVVIAAWTQMCSELSGKWIEPAYIKDPVAALVPKYLVPDQE